MKVEQAFVDRPEFFHIERGVIDPPPDTLIFEGGDVEIAINRSTLAQRASSI
jgi:hypothetical protein